MTAPTTTLKQRLEALKLPGLLAHWSDIPDDIVQWLETLADWEEQERGRRSLERRMRLARLGRFKALADFDWDWPGKIDQAAVCQLMRLDFIDEATNVILLGPNGVGKSTLAQNIAHQAVVGGYRVLFTTAARMLNDLAGRDGDLALKRRLTYYAAPSLLVIDELGYLSYGTRHADLLFEVVNRRYESRATIVTTNKPFAEWNEVFPNASCVVSLVDRLVHHADILQIEGESYRMKEARERAESKQREDDKTTSARSSTRKLI
jgi:DNA replication protein DnaC